MPAPAASGAKGDKGRWPLVWILAFIAVGVILVAGWWLGPWRAAGPSVQVEVMAPGPVTLVLAVSGKVAPRDKVQIRSAVSGTLLEVLAAEGMAVQRGDVLARLDPSQQEAIVRQAASALGQGQVLQQQAELAYQRNQELGSLLPRSRLEDSRLALDGAAQDVARLTALLDQATIQLGRFTLRAPMAGTITVRSVDPGQLVDPATALFTLADMTELLIETDVDEAYATRIAVGQAAAVRPVGGREILAGTVIFVSPQVNPATGGLAVKLALAEPLRAPLGLTVTANIIVGRETALTVPRTALQGDVVFLLEGNKAVLRPVTVTDWPAARLIVTEGLALGDRVIIDSTGLSDELVVDAGEP